MPAFTNWNEFLGALAEHCSIHSVHQGMRLSSREGFLTAECSVCAELRFFDSEESIQAAIAPTPPLVGPGSYHNEESPVTMFLDVRTHVESNHGHVVRSVDDPALGRWGFACVGCRMMWTVAVETWVRWRNEAPPEQSLLLRMFFFRRTHLAALLSSDGEFLRFLPPLELPPPPPPARSLYERLLEDDDQSSDPV